MTDRPVTRVLVANRGEIARRVVATCHRLGLEAVAVCSDPDIDAPHVREADTAVRLPGSAAADTYLRADLLVAAAQRAGADAVHPGYGFLSEDAGFARAVTDAGLTWIGPSPDAIAAMGSKIAAKRLVAAAGVPVLAELDPSEITEADLPVLVKASAGGGGRGMRVVADLTDLTALPALLAAAGAEATAAFGDGAVLVEPFVEHGHHVEIQVVADRHGVVRVLGERECSIQRRHQKVIEESPSPLVERHPGMRPRLEAAAAVVARTVDYTGLGTVEFLAAADGRFWFLEMNTRLQVEHPVTECTTGTDLVELQLRIAAGERLPEVLPAPRGAAVEARLYAEDPAAGWRPSTGELRAFELPATAPAFTPPALEVAPRGVRVDAGIEIGASGSATVGVHYDPLLAKVVAWAPTRTEAVALLARALTRARIHGLRTNRDLLVRVLRHQAFGAGDTDTGFLDPVEPFAAPLVAPDEERLAAVAAALAGAARRRAAAGVLAGLPSGWRNVPSRAQEAELHGPAGAHRVCYRFRSRSGRAGRSVTTGGAEIEGLPDAVLVACSPGEVVLEIDGLLRRWRVAAYPLPDGGVRYDVDGDVGAVTFVEPERFPLPQQASTEGSLRAPMPGTVVALRVAVGEHVTEGQELLVLEAMKMQHAVRADRAGRVTELPVQVGSAVDVGTVLAVVAESGARSGDEEVGT